jgi:hypothetical protein
MMNLERDMGRKWVRYLMVGYEMEAESLSQDFVSLIISFNLPIHLNLISHHDMIALSIFGYILK